MIRVVAGLLLTALALAPAWGQNAREAEIAEAARQAQAVQKAGPAAIALADQVVLKLPAGRVFLPMPEAGRLMRAVGNKVSDDMLGMVVPDGEASWVAVMRFEKAGYVKDDEARDWNADDLLKSLKDGTEAANADRRERGFPEVEVLGWIERPAYDAANHRLVWSAEVRRKNAEAERESSVNYNTYALGREGFVSLNLIDAKSLIEGDKPIARELLAGLEFNAGKRYADFDSSTDKVAEYGLAALVAGVAAKKLGLLALAAGFLVKFWKILVIAGLAFGGGFAKLFRRRKADAMEPPATP